MSAAARRFEVRFTGLNKAMVVLGLMPGTCHVDVGDGEVSVHMSWAFAAVFPRASIVNAELDRQPVRGWGVHGWRGSWLVNGSSSGMVRVVLDAPVHARLLTIVPVRLRELRVSVDRPDALVATLQR